MSSAPKFSLEAAKLAAKQAVTTVGSGVQEGFDELSCSLRLAGVYVGVGKRSLSSSQFPIVTQEVLTAGAAVGGFLIGVGLIVGAMILERRLRPSPGKP